MGSACRTGGKIIMGAFGGIRFAGRAIDIGTLRMGNARHTSITQRYCTTRPPESEAPVRPAMTGGYVITPSGVLAWLRVVPKRCH